MENAWCIARSNESDKPEAYIQRWPQPGPKIQISSEGETDPLWSQREDEILCQNANKMIVVRVSLTGAFKAGKLLLRW
jgi:hypothetical protein